MNLALVSIRLGDKQTAYKHVQDASHCSASPLTHQKLIQDAVSSIPVRIWIKLLHRGILSKVGSRILKGGGVQFK